MPSLILLTLIPTAPRDPLDFHKDLEDLVIDAYDLTVKDDTVGIHLGTAHGVTEPPYNQDITIVAGTPPHPDTLATPLIMHFDEATVSPSPQSVATAVIVIDIDVSTPDYEYNSFDLRITLSRGGKILSGPPIVEYNVPIKDVPGSLDPVPKTYIDYVNNDHVFPSAYVFVPPKPVQTPKNPSIPISVDGMTPKFDDLIASVNLVLAADHSSTDAGKPTSLQERDKPLTAAQSRQVAWELTYDRGALPLPTPTPNKTLEAMYSHPKAPPAEDQERKQFEGDLAGYHATHDAEALRLAGYVFAASAAIECEKLSLKAGAASLTFDVEGTLHTPATATPTVSVLLKGVTDVASNPDGRLKPTFGVPAAFFYALGTVLPSQIPPEDRYNAAVTNSESAILKALQTAQNAGILGVTEKTLTTKTPDSQDLVADQAARRLYALGSTNNSLPQINLTSKISNIVQDWLNYSKKTADIGAFWASESTAKSGQYLELILEVITAEKTDLKDKIGTVLNVKKASDLLTISDQNWRNFFIPPPPAPDRADLLPAYTEPGNTEQRTEAFINNLKKLLSMKIETLGANTAGSNGVPALSGSQRDAIGKFLEKSPGFSFANQLDENAIASTLSSLPMDGELQEWTNKAIHIIHFLYQITYLPNTPTPELQFSYMEALYARGFITADRIAFLSSTQFHAALAGTVAYPQQISDAIYKLAATSHPDPDPEPGIGFTAVNSGDLVNCIPPPNLSPIGPIEYLHEMLQLSVVTPTGTPTLADILMTRRGPIGNLKASMANLETSVPLIDLVNESLEALGTDLASRHGMVYDTSPKTLAGFDLGKGPKELDAEASFDAIPEHSSPAIPVGSPAIYDTLKKDFSAPCLPYSQDLDINRTYLCRVGTSRFDTMRTFRKAITEFALDGANEPTDFQRDVWRFPVRFDIAIEYLCISADEQHQLFTTTLDDISLANIFSFSATDQEWMKDLASLPSFLERTGLSYCEFFELWKCGFVKFKSTTELGTFPVCPPCCTKGLQIAYTEHDGVATPSLQKLAIFIRLLRKLECRYGKCYITFSLLAAICEVLHLFNGNDLNGDFVRQLVALFMLCDIFCLPLCEEPVAQTGGQPLPQERVKLLALWAHPETSPDSWEWAVEALLDSIEDYAKREFRCPPRGAGFKKILSSNLDSLSKLAGFTDTHPWNSTPVCTLRFAEVLAKIYASHYTVGEILFLFTNEEHLLGDDPFPYAEASESEEDPLNLPEDSHHGLWKLRKKLLDVEADEDTAKAWTWRRIENALRRDFGIVPSTDPKASDPLQALGEHFFPSILERHGCPVPPESRRFHTPLATADTSLLIWESTPHGPFHYRNSTSELWTELPLRDEDVLDKLAHLRQLKPSEQEAVRELYFAPRAILAPFGLLFRNFSEAVDRMVQEPSEDDRFTYFQWNFAVFHSRCKIIAEHLAEHVGRVTVWREEGQERHCETEVAWRILNCLFADENRPSTPWEKDSGLPPDQDAFMWDSSLSGNAFAALLGLVGTGLLGEYNAGGLTRWREVRGPLSAFGHVRNERNAAIPTIIPWLNISPSLAQQHFVVFRNGFALRDLTAENLGGAAPFSVKWTGVLLVEHHGDYRFHVRRPEPHQEHDKEKEEDHHDTEDEARWLVTVRRGQKTWTLLCHGWKSSEYAPPHESPPICLLRGGYEIVIQYEQCSPVFVDDSQVHPTQTGFLVQYCGPDTADELTDLPIDKLFLKSKHAPPSSGMDKREDNSVLSLKKHYVSSLRDIRRTYQRAFKAILFAHRYCLSAVPKEYCDSESELGFILGHPSNFLGTSYYHAVLNAVTPSYSTHRANFDFNFLPVDDAYMPPTAAQDDRVSPSPQRVSALFDWWERMFDYRQLAHVVHESLHQKHCGGPIWLLFYEAAVQQPVDGKTLVRHLGIDMSLALLVLTYFENYLVCTSDLEDERWPIRVWHARGILHKIQEAIFSRSLESARPDLWAANLPDLVVDAAIAPPLSGNQNLTHFVQQSCLLDNNVQQFKDIKMLNDGLRERAKRALIAYLCHMDRVSLSYTGSQTSAKAPQDLSDLLLQDVEVGLCEYSSRIGDAIQAVQTFVQRLRLGLEPTYTSPPGFGNTWDSSFYTFEKWKSHQRRLLYSENWIQWEELQRARESEAFGFLESSMARHTLTIPTATPPFVLDADGLPSGKSMLGKIQFRDFATLRAQNSSLDEGVELIGTPARDARPSWLSSISASIPTRTNVPKLEPTKSIADHKPIADQKPEVPMWFQAAVRLGTRFVRVAAAGLPPAMRSSFGFDEKPEEPCMCRCGRDHAPVMDEYYFWLSDGKWFDSGDVNQNADVGSVPPDPTSDWDRPDKLPALLQWPTKPLVHLAWTRVHLGSFEPPRRSDEGVHYDPSSPPVLDFKGRKADSLQFGAISGTGGSFRYDIATDSAIVSDSLPDQTFPASLNAYPYFIYFNSGAPLAPVSSFGTALSIAGTLRAYCCFEEALAWCRAAFDPLKRKNTWAQCPPKPNVPQQSLVNGTETEQLQVSRPDGPCCPTGPVKAGIARGRAVVLEYLDILLQWGDTLMCCNSSESTKQSLVLFNEAARILGPQPLRVEAHDEGVGQSMTIANFHAASAALNPRLICLFEKVFDRRQMVRNCLNARRLGVGRRRNLDSDAWRDCVCGFGKGEGCRDLHGSCVECCLPYRFTSLLPRATELVGAVKALGGALLSALERGDAEYLASLRQTHDRQLTELMLENKQLAFRESDWQVQSLGKQMEGAQTRLRYNQQLLKNGLNSGETAYITGTNVAMATRASGNASEGVGQGMSSIPDVIVGGAGVGGSPVDINQLPVGSKLAQVFQAAARILNTTGDIYSTNAGLSSTTGEWQRRADEWQHQVDVITIEIAQIKRQQLAADRRRDISLRDLNIHQEQIQHSVEIQDFMRDKLSKHDLYLFLQQETAGLYRRTYDLAYQAAREAQVAFQFERRDVAVELPVAAWDDLHEGLMAGDQLEFALQSMDRLYLKTNCREYELTKHLSLRLQFPLAFLQLKALGWCEFEIPEWMYDLDYPGQYMRRIKNVSVTIPCIVGPYVGVHCRLQLLSSGIRMDPSLTSAKACCCKDSRLDKKDSDYDDYHSLSRQFVGSEAIATSSGQNDPGLFELNFRDERFVPFEFSGAVSRWRIEVPPQNNQFDLETLSDFIMHLNYTAREGGAPLRRAADESAQHHLPGGGIRFFDVRHEFPDHWRSIFSPGRVAETGRRPRRAHTRGFPLRLSRRDFPFLTGRRAITVTSLHIFIESEQILEAGEHIAVQFVPEEHGKDKKSFVCAATAGMPCFYHGVLEACLGPVSGDEHRTLGHLQFPEALSRARVRQVYFLCHYTAREEKHGECRCGRRPSPCRRELCSVCGGRY